MFGRSTSALAPADRLRLVYEFVTSAPADGGLGITPETGEWDLVESVMLLHDKDFNDAWIRSWTRRTITTNQLIGIRDQVRRDYFRISTVCLP